MPSDVHFVKASKLDEAMRVLEELVDSLPKCDACKSPATRAYRRGEGRWCDARCVYLRKAGEPAVAPEYPRAVPLRTARALLAAWKVTT